MSSYAFTEADRVRTSYAREAQSLSSVEIRTELAMGGGFLVAAVALAFLAPPEESFPIALAAVYVLAVAAAGRVRFDIGAGFTVPVQVVFVPMLFAIPPNVLPLVVCLALLFGMAIDVVRGCAPADRVLLEPGNSWFAFGPAVVLALTHGNSPHVGVGVLAAALVAQFAGDFAANAIRELLRNGISIRELADEMRGVYLIDVCLTPVGLAIAFASEDRPWSVLLILPLFVVLGVFSHERRRRLEQLVELNDAYRGTAMVLGNVVEADDAYTGEHCRHVLELALEVADVLRLDAHRRRNVEFAALLHDVGKIAVPNTIINKTGPLDDREWAIMKMHTVEGQRMLDEVGGFMREVGQIVRSSHERWDGKGYPDGLAGEEIPLESRIVFACDAFNAMTTDRSYRAALSPEIAVAELSENAGSQFDPMVIDALMRMISKDTPSTAAETLTVAELAQSDDERHGALISR